MKERRVRLIEGRNSLEIDYNCDIESLKELLERTSNLLDILRELNIHSFKISNKKIEIICDGNKETVKYNINKLFDMFDVKDLTISRVNNRVIVTVCINKS